MLGTLLNDRYRLDAQLGQGGMGVVYRAHDTLLERDVAVKVVSDASLSIEGRARLLHEARAVARLNHPNIVAIYDAGEAHGLAFIVMELLQGTSLYDREPDSLDELLVIMQQVCAALEHAHAHGIIHRDLKPENVLVERTPTLPLPSAGEGPGVGVRAHLTDFGLARSVASRLTGEGAIVGTVFYLSPEQALGQAIDGRADLYALGVMLYELTAGRLPFIADNPLAVIAQHLHASVVPPSTYNPEIPPALEALIVQLLSKQPSDRPASAGQVRVALEYCGLTLRGQTIAPDFLPASPAAELSPLDRLARGRLVGREQEFARARTLWKQVKLAPGQTPVLLITGEPGVGKTPLVLEVTALAEVSGGRALSAECYAEGNGPYAPIAEVIQTALPLLEEPLADVVLADLLPLAPGFQPLPFEVLRRQVQDLPLLEARVTRDPQSGQQRLFDSVVALSTALTAQRPLLMVVEDIHWADAGTLYLLRHLARRSRTARLPLLILLTYRESEVDAACCLSDVLLDLNRERLATQIKLGRFTQEQTAELLTTMFGQEIPTEFVHKIYQETEGNLFFIEEICKGLIEAGEVYREGGRWRAKPSLSEMQLPQSVLVAIQARVARLPEPAQEALRLAAIIGREFDFRTLQKASDQDEEAVVGALELAERAQLITEVHRASAHGRETSPQEGGSSLPTDDNGRETFGFAHALIPAALRESVSGLRRRRLHRRVAAAIEALRPDDDAALAYHYAEAGDEALARLYYTRAGDRAAAVYANDDAIRSYTEALALTHEAGPQRFDLLSARARIYDVVARREEQQADAGAMLALADELEDDARRCDALVALADVYLATEFPRARELAEQAAKLAEALDDPEREAQALLRLAWIAWETHNVQESQQALEAAVPRFKEAGNLSEAAACLHTLSLVLGSQGLGDLPASQRAVEEAITLSRQAGDRRQEATGLRRLAIVLNDQYRFAEALPYAEKALALHRETGARKGECHALNVIGVIQSWLWNLEESEDYLRRSLEIAEAIGSLTGISNAVTNLLGIYYRRRGEYEGGLAFLETWLAKPHVADDEFLAAQIASERAHLLSSLGQYELALEMMRSVLTPAQKWLSRTAQGAALAFVGRMHAELGDFDGAHEVIEEASARLEPRETALPAELAGQLTNRAYVNLLKGRHDPSLHAGLLAGLEQARQAIQLVPRSRGSENHLHLVEARLVAAQLHLALGKADSALADSVEALHLAETCPFAAPIEQVLFAHAHALRLLGRNAEAADHLHRAYEQVMLVANNTHDETLRHSWLENVRANREIVAEWEKRRNSGENRTFASSSEFPSLPCV